MLLTTRISSLFVVIALLRFAQGIPQDDKGYANRCRDLAGLERRFCSSVCITDSCEGSCLRVHEAIFAECITAWYWGGSLALDFYARVVNEGRHTYPRPNGLLQYLRFNKSIGLLDLDDEAGHAQRVAMFLELAHEHLKNKR